MDRRSFRVGSLDDPLDLHRDGKSDGMFLETFESTPTSLSNPIHASYERDDGILMPTAGNSPATEDVGKLR